jgi:hypothetical protein
MLNEADAVIIKLVIHVIVIAAITALRLCGKAAHMDVCVCQHKYIE